MLEENKVFFLLLASAVISSLCAFVYLWSKQENVTRIEELASEHEEELNAFKAHEKLREKLAEVEEVEEIEEAKRRFVEQKIVLPRLPELYEPPRHTRLPEPSTEPPVRLSAENELQDLSMPMRHVSKSLSAETLANSLRDDAAALARNAPFPAPRVVNPKGPPDVGGFEPTSAEDYDPTEPRAAIKESSRVGR